MRAAEFETDGERNKFEHEKGRGGLGADRIILWDEEEDRK